MIEVLKKLIRKPVCDSCLGRQFSQLLSGMTNRERGRALRTVAAMMFDSGTADADPSNFSGFSLRFRKPGPEKECSVCFGLFDNLGRLAEKAVGKLKGIEFDTFLVGCVPSRKLAEAEERLWEEIGIEYCEPLKAEFNREMGKLIQEATGKTADLEKPDVVVLFDLEKGDVELRVNPIYIFGYYQKLVRGIPQCRWDKYRTSVEELVGKPALKLTKGSDHRFHGMGREDVSARCLAWRPFVIEVKEPRVRKPDLAKLEEMINRSSFVKVKGLRLCDAETVRKVKSARPDKTYRALVVLSSPVKPEDLEKLKSLVGPVRQRTPTRVLHRRSDLERERKVKSVKVRRITSRKFELTVRAEAGLYIKELVSGDGGRTSPSVSEILGVPAKCAELDVIEIDRVEL